uniref:Uncharacterized protein n=1 Tax=Arundo donax TaxID=35708 RepID=A0A0A8ZJV5_ARUDO
MCRSSRRAPRAKPALASASARAA